jgi:hypothetical protein
MSKLKNVETQKFTPIFLGKDSKAIDAEKSVLNQKIRPLNNLIPEYKKAFDDPITSDLIKFLIDQSEPSLLEHFKKKFFQLSGLDKKMKEVFGIVDFEKMTAAGLVTFPDYSPLLKSISITRTIIRSNDSILNESFNLFFKNETFSVPEETLLKIEAKYTYYTKTEEENSDYESLQELKKMIELVSNFSFFKKFDDVRINSLAQSTIKLLPYPLSDCYTFKKETNGSLSVNLREDMFNAELFKNEEILNFDEFKMYVLQHYLYGALTSMDGLGYSVIPENLPVIVTKLLLRYNPSNNTYYLKDGKELKFAVNNFSYMQSKK